MGGGGRNSNWSEFGKEKTETVDISFGQCLPKRHRGVDHPCL